MSADLSPEEDDVVGDVGDEGPSDVPLVGADDDVPSLDGNVKALAGVSTARATSNVNLRKAASTSSSILAVIPSGSIVTLVTASTTNGFYKVSYNGIGGYAYANYLAPGAGDETSSADSIDVDGPASPANAIARAKAAVGFSYYWGGAAWLESGPTGSTSGSCSGNCPSCSHRGSYGADCSGLVAKAWQFGSKSLSVNSHPYSTASFNGDTSNWRTVSRGSLRAGDALVYNSGGAGHVVIYEKGDGWGAPTVYECRGCSYGCVHNARTLATKFHGIRRSGF